MYNKSQRNTGWNGRMRAASQYENTGIFMNPVSLFIIFLTFMPLDAVAAEYTDSAAFRQNFESQPVGSSWFGNDDLRIESYTTGNIDGRIIRAQYIPCDEVEGGCYNGTPVISRRFQLGSSLNSATLSFDVKLHSKFEFVKGGKMHGLAGGTGTTGCNDIDPNGWSVRLTWASEGVPKLYIYHQDRYDDEDEPINCGEGFPSSSDFKFKRGKWYRVEIFVKMNSAVNSGDGRATLFIDGESIVDVMNLNLSGNSDVKIDQFMFSTFYGGKGSQWSPSSKTYAYFDNFTVHKGKRIAGDNGTACEIFEEGIYSSGTTACCAESCGSCGGSGCGSLPGGGYSCCTGPIVESGVWCISDGVYAPCAFYEEAPPESEPDPDPTCPYYDEQTGTWVMCQ